MTFRNEFSVDESRTLVMTYTVHQEYRVAIQPGGGSVARAIEDAVRGLSGQANVDADSVRFRIEGN